MSLTPRQHRELIDMLRRVENSMRQGEQHWDEIEAVCATHDSAVATAMNGMIPAADRSFTRFLISSRCDVVTAAIAAAWGGGLEVLRQ
jgi:hypothetical protein